MSKKIETCKSEEVLSSVLDQQPQDYPSVQQAVHDLGVTALPAASAADPDIAELPSNVEVFVRRVLKAVVYDRVLPVVQQMWQAVLNRISSPNYFIESLRPYAQDPSLRTLGTLPTALSALSPRKISNGGTQIPDGISLGHLICGSDNQLVEIIDDNPAWNMKSMWFTENFPYLNKLVLNCRNIEVPSAEKTWLTITSEDPVRFPYLEHITGGYYHASMFNVTAPLLDLPELVDTYQCRFGGGYEAINLPKFERVRSYWAYHDLFTGSKVKHITLPSFNYLSSSYYYDTAMFRCAKLEDITLPVFTGASDNQVNVMACSCPELLWMDLSACTSKKWTVAANCPKLARIKFGKVTEFAKGTKGSSHQYSEFENCGALIDIEFEDGVACNIDLGYWNPTDKGTAFLENFLHHIAERLAVGPTTNRLTLTLSADVYSACGFGATIDDTTDIRYLIKKAIQDRNWKVTDGTNNFNQ